MLARARGETAIGKPAAGAAKAPAGRALLINLAGFQLGWFACVLGAAHGLPWLGPLVALPVLYRHLRAAAAPAAEARLLLAAALVGLAIDSALLATGRLAFTEGVLLPPLAPYWMVTLWLLFASTFNVSLRRLRERPLFAAGLGAAGGPLAYLAGEGLGAARILEPAWATHLAVAVAYAVATPALLTLARRLDGFARGAVR